MTPSIKTPAGPPKSTALRAGVVGLGVVGGGIAQSLSKSGNTPYVFDVRPEVTVQLVDHVVICDSPRQVAEATDVVLIAVVDDAQVREVIQGDGGLLQATDPCQAIVITSTVERETVYELAQTCKRYRIDVLDCGVMGGSVAAEHGLVGFLGGDDDVVSLISPLLYQFAKEIVHCGPIGTGMTTKLASNAVAFACWRLAREILELAENAGVKSDVMMREIYRIDPSLPTIEHLRNANGDDEESSRIARMYFKHMTKDLEGVHQLALQYGTHIPLLDVTRECGSDTFSWLENS